MALTFNKTPFAMAPQPQPTQTEERPKAQVWLNVGFNTQVPNEETGEYEDVFIALPVGIPLDTMEAMLPKGSKESWLHMVQAKNHLLEQLKALAEGIEPGGEEIIDGLQVQVKRVGTPTAPTASENPFLTAMQGKLSVVR